MGTILSCPRYLDEETEVQRVMWLRASLMKGGFGFLTHALPPITGWALRIHRAVDLRDRYHGQTGWPGPQGSREMAVCKGNAEPESRDPELGKPGGEGQLCLGGDI